MKYEDLKCEFCNGQGEREVNRDGADVPLACSFCNETGIDQDQLKKMDGTFTDLTSYEPEQLKILLDTVKLRILSLNAGTHAHVVLVGWEEAISKAFNNVQFEKRQLPY